MRSVREIRNKSQSVHSDNNFHGWLMREVILGFIKLDRALQVELSPPHTQTA